MQGHSQKVVGCYQRIRILATILVVVGHCSSLAIGLQTGTMDRFAAVPGLTIPIISEFIRQIIYSFHMPLFVFLSGGVFALTYKEDRNWKQWLQKRVRRLLFPYFLLALFVYIPLRLQIGYYGELPRISEIIIQDILLGRDINYLWYLPMLLEVNLIVVLFRKWFMSDSRTTIGALLTICLAVSSIRYFCPELPLQLKRTMEFLLYFYIGILAEKYRSSGETYLDKWKVRLLAIWVLSGTAYFWMEAIINAEEIAKTAILTVKTAKMIVRVVRDCSACIEIFLLLQNSSVAKCPVWHTIDTYSFQIYLYHPILTLLFRYFVQTLIPPASMSNLVYALLLVLDVLIGIFGSVFVGIAVRKVCTFLKNKVHCR